MKRLGLLLLLPLLPGCEKAMHHMYSQPKYREPRATSLFADGTSARAPVPGTVPHTRGVLAATSSGRVGSAAAQTWTNAEAARDIPYPITARLLERGRSRFGIYCEPCHGPLGDGEGLVPRRGFPKPPSFHESRLRKASDRYVFDVVTAGHGIMYGYADRVSPPDRWAIVAYVRALQLSQDVPLSALPPDLAERFRKDGGQ